MRSAKMATDIGHDARLRDDGEPALPQPHDAPASGTPTPQPIEKYPHLNGAEKINAAAG
jgi:hypothetical protein